MDTQEEETEVARTGFALAVELALKALGLWDDFTEAARLAGVAPGTISRWLAGAFSPKTRKRRDYEMRLGLPHGFLDNPTMAFNVRGGSRGASVARGLAPDAERCAEALARLQAAVDELTALLEQRDPGERGRRPADGRG
jgi:hypothetical protein